MGFFQLNKGLERSVKSSDPLWHDRYSIFFDGVDEYINIDDVLTSLATTTKGTWSAWIKPVDAVPAVAYDFISFGDTDASEYLIFYLGVDGNLRVILSKAGVTQWSTVTYDNPFTDNTWFYIALVQDGISPIMYIDGSAPEQTFYITTDKTSWFNDLTGLDNGRIGNSSWNNNGEQRFTNGNIDEVGFFNTNLTPSQIQEIYNNGKPKNLLKHSAVNNLVSYFRMGDKGQWDGTNWTIPDQKGTNNGTSVNMEFADRQLVVP